MPRRLTVLAFSLALTALGQAPASARDLCAALEIPDQLGLTCVPAPEEGPGAVVVQPASGAFSSLSRMTLDELDRTADPLAWSDPKAWLREQMSVDTTVFAQALEGVTDSPDSPFASPTAQVTVQAFTGMVQSLGRLALKGCGEPLEVDAALFEMRCTYTAGGFGVYLYLRLLADGEERVAMSLRAMNEQRLQHFEAIANSFERAV